MADTKVAEGAKAEEAGAGTGGADVAVWLAALAPRDAVETMLAEQMAAVHAAGMRALKRAAECTAHPQIEALYLRQAARLMHLFTRQMEALDRRRVAAERQAMERVWEAERRARVGAPDRPEEEEHRTRERRAALWDLEPERPRRQQRRRTSADGKGGAKAAIELPDGLYIPDPLSG